MRAFIPNNISEEDAEKLIKIVNSDTEKLIKNNNYKFHETNLKDFGQATDILIKIFTIIFDFIDKDLSEKSLIKKNKDGIFIEGTHDKAYFRIEEGTPSTYLHRWHIDTGGANHMMWCRHGTSTLLSHPSSFKGAELEYCGCDKHCQQQMSTGYCSNGEVISKELHHLGTGIHDSSVLHRLRCGAISTDGVREGNRYTLLLFV